LVTRERPVAIAAAYASNDIAVQHQRPAVSLRTLSNAVEFRKGIVLKLVLFDIMNHLFICAKI